MNSFKRLMTSFGVLVASVAVFVVAPANAQTLKAVKDRGGPQLRRQRRPLWIFRS